MYSQPSISLGSVGSANLGWKIFEKQKKSRKVQKAKLKICSRSSYLRSIYIVINNCLHNILIVLGVRSDLELT